LPVAGRGGDSLAFAHSHARDQTWVQLVEKAYAKASASRNGVDDDTRISHPNR
jgi:hypothetical protein